MARRVAYLRAPARVLFKPVAVSKDSALTDAGFVSRFGPKDHNIGAALVNAARARSADLITPRIIMGQSKAVTAEIYYSTVDRTAESVERELKRRLG